MKAANVITWARFVLYVPITVAAYLDREHVVLVLFLIAMLTDYLDGVVARWTGTADETGDLLDSRIDMVGALLYPVWVWLLFPDLVLDYLVGVLGFLALLLIGLALSYWRTGQVAGLHLWSGKVAAVAGTILLPVLILFGTVHWVIWFVLGLAYLAFTEEILFFLLNRKNRNVRSILFE